MLLWPGVALLGAQPVPRWEIKEDLRLDANAENWSAVSRFYVDTRGRFAIPQPQDRQVLLYDSAGGRLATIGREGAGPGEFRNVGPINWIGDTVLIIDQSLRRVSYFDSGGKLLGTRGMPAPLGTTPVTGAEPSTTSRFFIPYGGTSDGSILGTALLRRRGQRLRSEPEVRTLLKVPRAGLPRVLAVPPQDNDERWTVSIGGLRKRIPFALPPQYAFAVDGSRFAFASATQKRQDQRYTIALFTAEAETVFVRTYTYEGVPIPSRSADSAIAAMASPQVQENGAAPIRQFQRQARARLPHVFAPFEAVVIGLDNTVWVVRRGAGGIREAVALNQDGAVVGMAALPDSARLQQASLSYLWATDTDADGLSSAVRYRIVR